MREKNNKRAVTVGIFIFVGILIFVAAILTLGGQKNTFEKKISIRAIFDDVGGLQTGNNVWFSGVKIGTVRRMTFRKGSQVEVVLNIERKARQYIRKDAKARISSEGFIGNKLVVLYGGTMEAPPVEENDVLGVEKALSTDEIMATLQKNNQNLLDITNNFKTISDRIAQGQGTVGKLISDEALVNSLETTMAGLRQSSANAQRLTEDVADYAAKLQRKGSLTNELVTDTMVFSRLKSTVTQLQQASKTANEITDNFKEVSSRLSQNKSPVGVLLNDEKAAADLQATLGNLQAGTKKLDENMEALQHNFLLRGFFRRKARDQAKKGQ
jgi:phospholipid/cholesterol/gamma-HCH transport system substrate-binding protein